MLVPKAAPVDDSIDWPRTIASIVVFGGMLLVLAAFALGLVMLVRWWIHKSEADRLALEAARLQQAAAWAAHEEQLRLAEGQRRAAMVAQHGAAEAARRFEEEQRQRLRLEDLTRRFGARDAPRIMGREIWQGQSTEALIEALGKPADMDEKVMKTKVRLVLKWQRIAANRFAVKVTLEDGRVTGWER